MMGIGRFESPGQDPWDALKWHKIEGHDPTTRAKMSRSRKFNTVGLVGRVGNPEVVDSVAAVARFLAGTGVELVLETATAPMLPDSAYETVNREALGSRCDLIVVVGGDGSMLAVARDLADSPALVVGVNRGGLGFLADVSPDQIEQKIGAVLSGEYTADERTLLEAHIIRSGEFTDSCAALNDVVVNAGAASRMMDFRLYVNGDFVYDQRSDGLIVSTPTRLNGLCAVRGRADHGPEPGCQRRRSHVSAYAHIAAPRGAGRCRDQGGDGDRSSRTPCVLRLAGRL